MKKSVITVFVCLVAFAGQSFGQTATDTIKVKLKIKELRTVEANLKKQIEAEDKKRGMTISGVSEESMSELNERQDSLCLALRSNLVNTRLEIKELEASITPVTRLTHEQAAANLHQGLSTLSSGTSSTAPVKPTKPQKKQVKGKRK